MSAILIFYAIALASIAGLAYLVYRVFSRRNKLLAISMALLALLVLSGLWPIPIHGGFTLLFEVFWQELESAWQDRQRAEKRVADRKFRARMSDRFRGTLNFQRQRALVSPWQQVVVSAVGSPAWLDTDSGLIWSHQIALDGEGVRPTLAEAKDRCRRLPPEGYWALPTESERYWYWKSGGARVLTAVPASSVSYLVDEALGMEIPVYDLGGSAFFAQGQHRVIAGFAVRCVARSAEAPVGGYSRSDIQLDEWNRYQLAKINR